MSVLLHSRKYSSRRGFVGDFTHSRRTAMFKRSRNSSTFPLFVAATVIFILTFDAKRNARAEESCDNDVTEIYVSYDVNTDVFRLQDNGDDLTVAHARFKNCVNSTGWSYLSITTVNDYTYSLNSSVQTYAAGLAEGYITRRLISLHHANTVGSFCQTRSEAKCRALETFLRQNLDWVIENVKANPQDEYWYQVRLYYEQVRGIHDGYAGTPGRISMNTDDLMGLYLLQIGPYELQDLQKALWGPDSLGHTPGHCSVLIKLLPGNQGVDVNHEVNDGVKDSPKVKDVLMAHDMWTSYNAMLRVLKRYNLNFDKHPTDSSARRGHGTFSKDTCVSRDGSCSGSERASARGTSWAFSSYPGTTTSGDDFYVLSSAMVVMETTNPIFNKGLYRRVQPHCVLESGRVTVANRLADSGDDWSQIFSRYNSGTYNNQWMVVDYKQYDEYRQQILPGFLTVLEQIPGQIRHEDVTQTLLNQTYWASYNLPYFPDIFEECGLPAMVSEYGDFFNHDASPRARMFCRDHSTVTDVDSMTRLMRYNDFQEDPLARCNCTPPYSGDNGISARSDLNPPDGTYPFPELNFGLRGGIDMKLTSMSQSRTGDMLAFRAISGPTFDPLPPFRWSTAFNPDNLSHWGHPDLWNFGPVWFNGTF